MALTSIAQSAVAAGAQDAAGRSGWTSGSPSGSSVLGMSNPTAAFNLDDYFSKYSSMIKENAAQNNAWSAEQAQINRDWQERMLNANNSFNSKEAQKNRDWQERLSNTAHQREVKDLLAAGLNPVLSAMNGNGASTTSGATASSGGAPSGGQASAENTSAALTNLLGALVSSQVQQENARLSAQTNLAVAEKYNAMSKYTAELQARTQLTTTNIQTAASKWMAELSAKTSLSVAQTQQATQKIVANIQAAAQRYGYQLSSWTQTQVAQINGQINKELKQMGINADFKMQDTDLAWKSDHPSGLDQYGSWKLAQGVDALETAVTSGKSKVESAYRASGAQSFMERSIADTIAGWLK